jgi:hypothetical protein
LEDADKKVGKEQAEALSFGLLFGTGFLEQINGLKEDHAGGPSGGGEPKGMKGLAHLICQKNDVALTFLLGCH